MRILTFNDYIKKDTGRSFYEIIDGLRIYTAGKSCAHNTVKMNIASALREFSRRTGSGKPLFAPFDIVVSKEPLCVRQPDCSFVSSARWAKTTDNQPPLSDFAPEIVVEVACPVDQEMLVPEKLPEYARAGVVEAWIGDPECQYIEQWALSATAAPTRITTLSAGDTLKSLCIRDLTLNVAEALAYEEYC